MGRFHVDVREFPHNHYPLLKALYRVPATRLAPSLSFMTADTVSLLAFGCGISAAFLLAMGRVLPAIALLHASMLLDYVDGEVARYREESSIRGAWLEVGLDKIQAVLVFLGLAVGAGAGGADATVAWSWAFASVSAYLLGSVLRLQRIRIMGAARSELRARSGESRPGSPLRTWAVAVWRETAPGYVVWLWILTVGLLAGGALAALQAAAVYGWIRCILELVVGSWRARGLDRARSRG